MAGQPGTGEVEVRGQRVLVYLECCPDATIALAKAATGPGASHDVACPECGKAWTLCFLAERRHGLRVSWRAAG